MKFRAAATTRAFLCASLLGMSAAIGASSQGKVEETPEKQVQQTPAGKVPELRKMTPSVPVQGPAPRLQTAPGPVVPGPITPIPVPAPLPQAVQLQGLDQLQLKLQQTDLPVRVIVQYNQAAVDQGESRTTAASVTALKSDKLQAANNQTLTFVQARGIGSFRPIPNLPLATMEVTRNQLGVLQESGQFALVVEDKLSAPMLASSGTVIGVADAHALEARGAGTTIAILDTGVDRTHPFFGGRVVEGACYSSNVASQGATSLCPGGATSATTLVSGGACTGSTSCDHGTHVAGIAAGDGGAFDGVAPRADIMSVQVFSLFTDSPGGPQNCANAGRASPCVLTYDSDQIRGLQRVNARRAARNIVAANMSLGGGNNTGTCNGDVRKPVIDQLWAAGVATVIASGNNSRVNAVSAPGCISTAVTVGSTTDGDAVSGFSNMSNTVDLLAPGSSINSSVPGGGFQSKNGTSMAAPQVAGAIAALVSLSPDTSISDIVNTLRTTGVNVTDGRTGGTVTRRRINLAAAAEQLAPRDDCITHNTASLSLVNRGGTGGWTITDGRSLMFAFGSNKAEGEAALAIIRKYGFDRTCYVGRPNPSMTYLLAGTGSANGAHGLEDCISFSRSDLSVERVGSQWRLTDGRSSMKMFPNNSEAQQALDAINRHRFNRQCYVGRPGPSFTYWLAQ
ncbi:S8 family serine peptidase [Hyphomonas sp.]|uniref:S8 family peptidase n=1 Tax=Hyphomonas sp. TaxID=87 RepID=UPI001BCDE356|nr:S8 family serine peptidase [Hyphomonas sp.]